MIISRGKAPGILRTIATYQNFELKADFWADETMNSAIFVRCPSDLKTNLSSKTCYEVNIYRPARVVADGQRERGANHLARADSNGGQMELVRDHARGQQNRRQVKRENHG